MFPFFFNNLPEIPLSTDSEEEEGHSATSDTGQTVTDLINIFEEIEVSGDEAYSFVNLKLEEEQEEPGVLLTGQEDSEEEQTSANGAGNGEEGEGEEEEQINVSCAEESEEAKAVSCPSDV